MKNIYINQLTKLLSLVVLFCFSSCDMDLNEEVYSAETSENFFQNEEQVMAAYVKVGS